jgi:hypothetical protein
LELKEALQILNQTGIQDPNHSPTWQFNINHLVVQLI